MLRELQRVQRPLHLPLLRRQVEGALLQTQLSLRHADHRERDQEGRLAEWGAKGPPQAASPSGWVQLWSLSR